MFTGLIEHLGVIVDIQPTTEFVGYAFTIGSSAAILGDCQIGDSIAVNGCCLTVTEFDIKANGGQFKVGLSNETLSRTNLGQFVRSCRCAWLAAQLLTQLSSKGEIKVGDKVNCERAMAGHGRFGGHFVQVRSSADASCSHNLTLSLQGHVDCTALILSRTPDGDSVRMLFAIPKAFYTALIPKGYIALDGTSLTLTTLSRTAPQGIELPPDHAVFGVMLVEHTQTRTVVGFKQVGEKVNVECDVVGKGVESVVRNVVEGDSDGPLRTMIESIVEDVLAKKGIIKG